MNAVAFNLEGIPSTLESMTIEQKGALLKETLSPKKFDLLTEAINWDDPSRIEDSSVWYEEHEIELILDMLEHTGAAGTFMHAYMVDEQDTIHMSRFVSEEADRRSARNQLLLKMSIPVAIVLAIWIFI